jgi:hypothetical protein
MAAIGAAFLCAIGRALARIHVENDHFRRSPLVHRVNPPARHIGIGKVLRPRQPVGLEAPIWLADAADPVIARSPTTQRIAGSPQSLSASFTSSWPASRPNTDWRSRPASRWRPFLPLRASASVSAAVSVRLSVSSGSR